MMKNNEKLPSRRSIRLQGYDYSQEGAYFVTICTHKHLLLFEDEEIKRIVETAWLNTSNLRNNIELDEYVIMPNHMHGIIIINWRFYHKQSQVVGAYCNTPLQQPFENANITYGRTYSKKLKSPSQTIGAIVRGFKGATSRQINIIRKTPGMRVWQRNFYDHIIRDERDLYKIRNYIQENPLKWEIDRENPVNL